MRFAAILAACFVVACSEGDGAPIGEAGAGPRVTLGTGQLVYEELSGEPPEMELISGPQGGWHLDVTLRLVGYARERLEIEYRVERERDGLVLCRTPLIATAAGLLDRGGGVLERVADRAILDISAPEDVVGDRLRVRASVRDAAGREASDERVILVADRIAEL